MFESVPQAYLQAHVLLHTEQHVEPFQLVSVAISGLSLAFGLVTSLAEMLSDGSKAKTAQGKVLGFVFFALDIWARCATLALGLVPSVRRAAFAVIAGYWILSLAAFLKFRGWPGHRDFVWEFVVLHLLLAYLVPAVTVGDIDLLRDCPLRTSFRGDKPGRN